MLRLVKIVLIVQVVVMMVPVDGYSLAPQSVYQEVAGSVPVYEYDAKREAGFAAAVKEAKKGNIKGLLSLARQQAQGHASLLVGLSPSGNFKDCLKTTLSCQDQYGQKAWYELEVKLDELEDDSVVRLSLHVPKGRDLTLVTRSQKDVVVSAEAPDRTVWPRRGDCVFKGWSKAAKKREDEQEKREAAFAVALKDAKQGDISKFLNLARAQAKGQSLLLIRMLPSSNFKHCLKTNLFCQDSTGKKVGYELEVKLKEMEGGSAVRLSLHVPQGRYLTLVICCYHQYSSCFVLLQMLCLMGKRSSVKRNRSGVRSLPTGSSSS